MHLSKIVFICCLLSILSLSSLILVSWDSLPPELPLFYSRPWGEPILATPMMLWLLPAISTVAVVVNFGVSTLVADSKFLARVLLLFALLVTLLATYTGAKIITLVT